MIKKGMNVKVLTGKDKNKTGEIIEVDKKKGEVWNRTNKCQTSFAADYHCMMANYAAASNNSPRSLINIQTTNNNSESEKKEVEQLNEL